MRACTLLTKPLLKQAFAGMMGKETKWGSGRLLVNSLGEEVRAVGSFLPHPALMRAKSSTYVRIAAVVDGIHCLLKGRGEKVSCALSLHMPSCCSTGFFVCAESFQCERILHKKIRLGYFLLSFSPMLVDCLLRRKKNKKKSICCEGNMGGLLTSG